MMQFCVLKQRKIERKITQLGRKLSQNINSFHSTRNDFHVGTDHIRVMLTFQCVSGPGNFFVNNFLAPERFLFNIHCACQTCCFVLRLGRNIIHQYRLLQICRDRSLQSPNRWVNSSFGLAPF